MATTEHTEKTVAAISGQDAKQRAKASEQWQLFQTAKANHGEYLKRANKCSDFYMSKQWAEKDEKKLNDQGRPVLTINQILPIVNTALGEQASRRAQVKFKPKRDASTDDAAMMGKVFHHITEENMYDWVESQVFADGMIEERGFFDIRIDFDENLLGHIKITSDDPGDVIPDRHAKEYDPSTWNEVWFTRWASLDYIELNYGVDKRRILEGLADEGMTRGSDSFLFEDKDQQNKGYGEGQDMQWFDTGQTSREEKRRVACVRIIERQFKQLHWAHFFVDPVTGDKKEVPGTWPEERVEEFALRMGLYVSKVRHQRIRWRVTADSVLLHDDWSPYRSYTKVPFFPYFRRGKSAGLVTPLISPQEMVNKINSQIVHVVNTTANSGWVVEQGSLANMTTAQLEKRGAETGLVIEVQAGAQAPEKIKPNTIPTGLERIATNTQFNMKAISGISEAMLGMEREVSGVALGAKEARGQVMLQVPLDNLAKTRHFVVRKILELIQQFMTEERIITITNERPIPGQEETEELVINRQLAGEILNDVTRGTYSWVISSQPARDSFHDSQFAEAMELVNAGMPIPPDRIVEYSNLERKFELAEEMRQLMGRGTPSEEEMQMAQVMQQMAMMREQLELAELESKVMKLKSETALNFAKTGQIDSDVEARVEEMEKEIMLAREGFEVRKQLAQINKTGKLEGQVINHYSNQQQQMTKAQIDSFARRSEMVPSPQR
jgi:hypothetical protein